MLKWKGVDAKYCSSEDMKVVQVHAILMDSSVFGNDVDRLVDGSDHLCVIPAIVVVVFFGPRLLGIGILTEGEDGNGEK